MRRRRVCRGGHASLCPPYGAECVTCPGCAAARSARWCSADPGPRSVAVPGLRCTAARCTAPGTPEELFERRHHVLREPAQLFLELLGREALGPVDHEILEPGISRRDRLDAVDHIGRRAAEPRLLRDAVLEPRRARGRAGRAPGAPLLVGITHEAERREPLEA